MARYNNSYRMIHRNSAGVADAICNISGREYDQLKRLRHSGMTFHGNGVVKTITVHDFYELYDTIRNLYYKRQLNNI